MHRPKSIDAKADTTEDLIATLEDVASDLQRADHKANKELRRSLKTAIDALSRAQQVGLKDE